MKNPELGPFSREAGQERIRQQESKTEDMRRRLKELKEDPVKNASEIEKLEEELWPGARH